MERVAFVALMLLTGSILAATPTALGADGGPATPRSAASCVGLERSTRNAAGGDLEKGGFGVLQRDRAKAQAPHGQYLKEQFPPGPKGEVDDCTRLNEIQVIGTHNSYHIQPSDSLNLLLSAFSPDTAQLAMEIEYTHIPLQEQLSFQGIRQIELDVFNDPDPGGLYSDPAGPRLVEAFGLPPGPPFDPFGMLFDVGLKALHVQDIDFRSNCITFVDCLERVQLWSADHPGHLPILILVEAKDEPIPDPGFGFVVPPPFDAEALDRVDAEIRMVFPPEQLLVPDDVRGGRAALEDAILLDGWPTLGAARGRVLFALDNTGIQRDLYLEGHPSLAGRVMFVSAMPGVPEAAFVKLNDPIGSFDLIQQLVADGFVVRTRADADTQQARSGDTTRRDFALESGAQWVSTDYPDLESNPFGTDYFVEVPGGGQTRCNPISAPSFCDSSRLEALDDDL